MKTCPLCDRDVLEEDLFTCDSCGKLVCDECIIRRGVDDEVSHVCKGCTKGAE